MNSNEDIGASMSFPSHLMRQHLKEPQKVRLPGAIRSDDERERLQIDLRVEERAKVLDVHVGDHDS